MVNLILIFFGSILESKVRNYVIIFDLNLQFLEESITDQFVCSVSLSVGMG